jgi:DNA topoisomerase-1
MSHLKNNRALANSQSYSNIPLMAYWLFRQFGNLSGGNKKKWNTLQHNGLLFPHEYVPHNIPLIYKNQPIALTKDMEEIATMYTKYLDTEYIKNSRFNKNFWSDWKKILGKDHVVQSLEDCDFGLIHKYLLEKKEESKNMSKEEKEKIKEERDEHEKKYKIAMVDGKEQPVGNFRMEPPGIFVGRGDHPQIGRIKKRIYPEDIIINIGKEYVLPAPNDSNGNPHKWKKVIHNKDVEWLASWNDTITGKVKYVWLGAHSEMKGKNDMAKFDLARKLKKHIKEIRLQNIENLHNHDIKIRQTATALYFIDMLALRVGNEKGDDEADTVGVTSLRCEHVELLDSFKIKLDFLGKDSVRYLNKLEVDKRVYANLEDFMKNKEKHDQLFDQVIPNDLNKYLQSFMKNLSAKVFRTYNASQLFYAELKKINKKYIDYAGKELDNAHISVLIDEFNNANAKVATLCNHQKNVSKTFGESMEKIEKQIKETKKKLSLAVENKKSKENIMNLKEKLSKLKLKRNLKKETKNIALGTSKINYIDPRITIAFMKTYNIPIEKILSKTLQQKFAWAMDVQADFKF